MGIPGHHEYFYMFLFLLQNTFVMDNKCVNLYYFQAPNNCLAIAPVHPNNDALKPAIVADDGNLDCDDAGRPGDYCDYLK